MQYRSQVKLPIIYDGKLKIEEGYRIDVLVEEKIILELKVVESLKVVHKAQLLTYLKLSNKKLGLLINFNEELLKKGIKRYILD
ncbi:GxxExxY protein [Psychrilyobacter piezotolerans]|uniref:GxxExxY protein n=1 Tax=Psychrilyobacter piezotolerans TaxID=2293438 RepID=A0ABX9KDR0_9FUSO|nr:GxxExxY protein [Psychrilyobacter piezotolerans]RDE58933.1 GxxExxY protein [Psychrilyobacter sp. S5]REI39484.1 GxxExxY protein [Psychrilyobacter piezotolerans]